MSKYEIKIETIIMGIVIFLLFFNIFYQDQKLNQLEEELKTCRTAFYNVFNISVECVLKLDECCYNNSLTTVKEIINIFREPK